MNQLKESTYLYSSENRDLYHHVLDQFNNNDCVFSRNLMAFIESPQNEPGPFYSRHINECGQCQAKVRAFSQTLKNVRKLIPENSPPEGFNAQVSPEIQEALKFLKKRIKVEENKNLLFSRDFVRQAIIDFFTIGLRSQTFFKGIALAALSTILVYIFV